MNEWIANRDSFDIVLFIGLRVCTEPVLEALYWLDTVTGVSPFLVSMVYRVPETLQLGLLG